MPKEKVIDKEEIAYRKNNLYDWIQKKVIFSCTDPAHLDACRELITFFEKKGEDESSVKALRVSLEFKERELKEKGIMTLEDKIIQMWKTGKYEVKEVAEILGVSLYKVTTIVTVNLKTNKS